jgi:hypothetical protein
MRILVKGFGLLLSLLVVGVALPQPSGGAVSVNEGICDDLMYATPGLYGLCVAYCEARDCVQEEGTPPSIRCNDVPNSKILANYNRKKTESDPPMPCLAQTVPCPCWTADELAAMFPATSVDHCHNNLDLNDNSTTTCTGLNVRNCFNLDQVEGGAGLVVNGFSPNPTDPPMCFYRSFAGLRFMMLTTEVAAACSQELQARGNEGGWSCFP